MLEVAAIAAAGSHPIPWIPTGLTLSPKLPSPLAAALKDLTGFAARARLPAGLCIYRAMILVCSCVHLNVPAPARGRWQFQRSVAVAPSLQSMLAIR